MIAGNNRYPGGIGKQRGQQAHRLAELRRQCGRRQVSGDQDMVWLQTCNPIHHRRQPIKLEPPGAAHEQFHDSQGAPAHQATGVPGITPDVNIR